MKRTLLLAAALALGLAAPASAKGPDQATITGPGLDTPIVLGGDAEGDGNSQFGRFVNATGFMPGVFAQTPDPMLDKRPEGDLGPRYTVVYRVPGGDTGTATVNQDLYPYAAGGPVTYMKPGQLIFGGQHATRGGWFTSRYSGLKETLTAIGFPTATPTDRSVHAEPERRSTLRWLPFIFAGLVLPASFFASRRRAR